MNLPQISDLREVAKREVDHINCRKDVKLAMATQPVDWLLTHGTVVAMDDARRVIEDGAMAVREDEIVAVGDSQDLARRFEAKEILDCTGCAIIPGLVNAHTHVPMTLLRGLADDLRLDVWLYGYMMPVEREFVGYDYCRVGTLLACAEMIRSGISTFCDMYYYEDEVAQATAEAGLRAICAQTILKFPAPDATSYEESLAYCREFIEKWQGHPLIVPAVGPHAAYTATPELLRASANLALEYDVPLHIHVSETSLEVEESRAQNDMPVVPWLKKQHVLEAKVIAAHCVHLDEGEMHALHKHSAGVAHCPSSNLKLASGVAPVQKMLDVGLHVGIGTDGPASNNDLDMFEETRLAALLAKGYSSAPTALPAKTALALATIEGARALHLGDITGSLEVGKRADIAVVELSHTHTIPRFQRDPDAIYSQIVYAAKSTDVRDLLVNGRPLMCDRQLLTVDERAYQAEAEDFARRIDSFLIAREGNLLSKLLAIGSGVIPQETFEIQVKAALDRLDDVLAQLEGDELNVPRSSVRVQYDTYFFFKDGEMGRLRYREDEVVSQSGEVREVFYTMTLMGPAREREYANSVVLTRSRYAAPADRSLRFYREYFEPDEEQQVIKHRQRFHIIYKDTDFAINLDQLDTPRQEGYYLEIKSRTWSARDAEHKARLIGELLDLFRVKTEHRLLGIEYVDFEKLKS
jgi:5-methylthioadenosine/S-adenosylhomocysteine deaminase